MAYQDGDLRRAWKPGPRVRGAFAGLLDLVLPPQALDGGERPMTSGLSVEAWGRIQFIEAPLCDGCGAPYEFDTGQRCAACTAHPRAFDRARAACFYDDASRELILQFKHADRVDLVPLFTAWLRRAAPDLLAQCDAIAPVPLHRGRLFKRKYNQAAELARPLARSRWSAVYLRRCLAPAFSATPGSQARQVRARAAAATSRAPSRPCAMRPASPASAFC